MKKFKKIIRIVSVVVLILVVIFIIIDIYILRTAGKKIVEEDDISDIPKVDCILVLGAGIWGDKPSPMLEDRLLECIKLYKAGVSDRIIMSGDNSKKDYDEVSVMEKYVIDKGIPAEAVFKDHAGFSTYESMYRARDIFQVSSMVVVTQKYHLYRALYIADKLGIEAYGAGADPRRYKGEFYRQAREMIARNKDFFKCIIKPEPTYLGDPIPLR